MDEDHIYSLSLSHSDSNHSEIKFKFILKLLKILQEEINSKIITWNLDGTIILIYDLNKFRENILPKYFKHNNISNFIRQLNLYGFRKERNLNKEIYGFSSPLFLRDDISKLKFIKRNKKDCLKNDPLSSRKENIKKNILHKEHMYKCLSIKHDMLIEEKLSLSSKIKDQDEYISNLISFAKDISLLLSNNFISFNNNLISNCEFNSTIDELNKVIASHNNIEIFDNYAPYYTPIANQHSFFAQEIYIDKRKESIHEEANDDTLLKLNSFHCINNPFSSFNTKVVTNIIKSKENEDMSYFINDNDN